MPCFITFFVSNKMKVKNLQSKTSLDYKEFLIFHRNSKASERTT